MPEIVRLSNCKICMYADDHLPPHFHVRGLPGDWDISVDLRTLAAIVGSGRKKDIKEAIQWAANNLELLRKKWEELNERD